MPDTGFTCLVKSREQRSVVRNHQPKLEDKSHRTDDIRLLSVCADETHCVGDVVDHDGSLGPPVVHGRQTVIPFLPCSVPDLKLDCCIIQTYCLCEEGRCKENTGHKN